MKKYLTLAASALLLAACTQTPGFEITGTVADAELNGKYVYLYEYGANGAAPLDSSLVENGAFSFNGAQASPALRKIAFADDVVQPKRAKAGENSPFTSIFVLENGKTSISLEQTASFAKGTPENDALTALQKEIMSIREGQKSLAEKIKSEDKEVSKAAEKEYDAIDNKIAEMVKSYILANNDKQTAAKLLFDFRYNINEESQNEIIAKAGERFKAVPYIDQLMEHLEVLKKVAVGKKFTDFEMAGPDGKMHKLSDYVGNGKNVVLIDFWASWCPPCRRDMPNIVAAYKKYKSKGFEIVGVSLDHKAEAWAKGVKDLNITWPQLSDLKGWKNEGAKLYGVNSIPHTLLVDKDGTIIAKGLHGEEIAAKLEEILK